ncbi:hypothetical protein N7530_007115 [Penicillium desertorum]|uniref:SHSP domain-containing protein n=1 Tax=Penicillium desertorum TaxID=1303715 RepID=A0A9W9WMC4_9EURO|nr:hypothetical protein N7530_007115 [Penicillium desertorum]
MSIQALNQNLPSLDSAANAEEQGPSRPFFPAHGAGDHPYPNPWSVKSGNGDVGSPGHPYPSPWAQADDEGQGNEANDEMGDLTTSRRPYPYPGPAESHPPYTFPGPSQGRKPYPFPDYAQQPYTYPGPLPWHQPHAYPGPGEGRKPYPSPWDDDKTKHSPRKPYPYPRPAGGHKPHPYPGAVPWSQPYPSPREEDDKHKPSAPRQPYQLPARLHAPNNRTNTQATLPVRLISLSHTHSLAANTEDTAKEDGADTPPSASHISVALHLPGSGEGDSKLPHVSHGPWAFSQQVPFTFPSTGSEKYKPEVDVFDTPETFLIHVPLPGSKKEDIEVNWDSKAVELSITGVISRPGSEDLVKTIALDERKVGAFERKVRLGNPANPPKVDGDAISAKLEDGILAVEVPKTEPDDVEVKKVEVE